MNPIKAFLIAGVLCLAVGSAWPQHGQPGVRPGEGGATGSGLTPRPNPIALYNFNDPTDLGADYYGNYDLTPVNTPTALSSHRLRTMFIE